jgi:hypothetical protein
LRDLHSQFIPIVSRICKLLRGPRIYSRESIPREYVAWWARTTTLFLLGFGFGFGFGFGPHRLLKNSSTELAIRCMSMSTLSSAAT